MRNRKLLPIALLAFALGAPAAMAAPIDKGDKGKSKDHKWKDDGERRDAQGIPPGHLPPAGECRVWIDGRPPGHQPAPTDCATARREASRSGGRVIYGDDRGNDRWDDDRWDDNRDGERWRTRFDSLDRNDDGYLSRSEWTADDRIFEHLDVNEDGRLSRSEIRDARNRYPDGGTDREVRLEERFRNNDDNRDGRLSQNEWWGRAEGFDRLDRNNDGYLSWGEVQERTARRSTR